MAYIVTPVAAEIAAADLEWTPLAQRCECVIEWGWNTKIANPIVFMQWCSLVVFQRCPWHDLSIGPSINTDDDAVIMAGGSDGSTRFAARRASGPAVELGRRLTADLTSLANQMRAAPSPSEMLSHVSADDRKWLPEDNEEAAYHWFFDQLTTIILNRGFSVADYITQLSQTRKTHVATTGEDSDPAARAPRAQADGPRRSRYKPNPPISEQRKLFQLSGNRCAFESCRRLLTEDKTAKDRLVSLGDVAHIVAQSSEGPRGDVAMSARERDQYENLILLCKHHHGLVDKQPHTYTADILREMKAKHEAWVDARLDGDAVNPGLLQWFIGDAEDFPVVACIDNRALLGIHPAIQLPPGADLGLASEYPTYIERDFDPLLRESVRRAKRKGGFVALVGPSASGKSRSAFEAIRSELSDWRLIIPPSAQDLAELVASGCDLGECVIWLDELADFIASGDLAVRTVQRLIAQRRPTMLIGGIWPADFDRAWRMPSRQFTFDSDYQRRSNPAQPQRQRSGFRALQLAERIDVPGRFSSLELERAKSAAALDPRIATAISHDADASVASVLASTPWLIQRWRQPSDPIGAEIVAAATEARLCWHPRLFTSALLKELTEQRLSTTQKARLKEDWFEVALRWACDPIQGHTALLTAHARNIGAPKMFEVADMLVDETYRQMASDRRPIAIPWDCLIAHAEPSACVSVGAFAFEHGQPDRALQAWHRAANEGIDNLESMLAHAYYQNDELDEARARLERGLLLGTVVADEVPFLAMICEQVGDHAARDHWLERAANSSEPTALWALGQIAEEKGDDDGAATWYLRAMRHEETAGNALNSMGLLLSNRGDKEGARAYLQRAVDEHHNTYAMVNLGLMLIDNDDRQAGACLFHQAAVRGEPLAAALLGDQLRAAGDDIGAIPWLHRAVAGGVVEAIAGLATALWQSGHTDEAAQWYRVGVDRGDLECTAALGSMLDDLGDTSNAQQLLLSAARAGHAGAMGRYAIFLAEHGQREVAAQWISKAAEAGDPFAEMTAEVWDLTRPTD